MSQYPPDTAEIETLSVWQRATPTQKKKFQMSFRGMWRWDDYSDSQNCMVTKGTCLSQCCYRDATLRHNFRCPDLGKKKKEKAALQKIQRSTSRQVERFMLSRPWAHLVGVYLEFSRELKLSVRMRGATVKQQMCVRSSLMREKQERTIHSVSVADICIQDRLYGPS